MQLIKKLTPKKNLTGINQPLEIQDASSPLALRTTRDEGDLVRELRGEQSYRDFAGYLNERIPAGMPGLIGFQSVWNWENGVHPITGECLMAWMAFYPKKDLRHQLALDVIAMRMNDAEEYSEENGSKLLKAVVK